LVINNALFYYENENVLERYINKINESPSDIDMVTSSHLRGTVDVKNSNNYVLFTIPYEKAWLITIDGRKTEPVMVFDALMAVPVSEGVHYLELKYIPSGLYAGMAVSSVSLLAFLIIIFFKSRHTVQKNKSRVV
jgi:uncharacterized membrane protein YfhO